MLRVGYAMQLSWGRRLLAQIQILERKQMQARRPNENLVASWMTGTIVGSTFCRSVGL